jgi:hypothetical protein
MENSNMNTTNLLPMLSVMRPSGSKAERRFIKHFLSPLGLKHDDAGNLYKRIGDLPVLWSSHTDTVHGRSGLQAVTVLEDWALLADGETANCLGADDTVGVWLMSEMIKAKRPGLYIFHRGEECGGKGSSHIARNPKLLDGIECAIAFDRKGHSDVITHQCGRCCSDKFALSLAGKLGGTYKPCSGGVFTDTANYVDRIGECTNLSVGYYDQHSKRECTDLQFAAELRDKLLDLDFSDLETERKPGEKDTKDWSWSNHPYDLDSWDNWGRSAHPYTGSSSGWSKSYGNSRHYTSWYDYDNKTMEELVEEFPDEVATILEACGVHEKELLQELRRMGVIE